MGTFSVPMKIGHLSKGGFKDASALVDTGATHSMIPTSVLTELGIEPEQEKVVRLADGNLQKFPVGSMWVAHGEQQWPCLVIFGPEGQYIMGATTLENFGLTVDPIAQELVPVEYIAKPF